MKRNKKIMRVLVAMVCLLSMVFQSISGFTIESKAMGSTGNAAGTYKEYTFSDAGIADQEGMMWSSNPDIVAGDLPGENLDGVAFNGKVKFEDGGDPFMHTHTYLRIGSTLSKGYPNTNLRDAIFKLDSDQCYYWYEGIRIAYEDGKLFVRDDNSGTRDNDFYIAAEDLGISSLLGEYLNLRLTFDIVEKDMIVNMTVSTEDGQHTYTHKQVYAGLASVFGNTISARSNTSNKFSIASFIPEEPEEPVDPEPKEYTERTFSDAGIADQEGMMWNSNPKLVAGRLPEESLDGVAFNGKVKIEDSGDQFAHTHFYVRIGTTIPDTFEDKTGLLNVAEYLDSVGAFDWYGGIRITIADGKLLFREEFSGGRDNDFYVSAENLGINSLYGEYLTLRLTFDVVENDMIMNLTVSTADKQHSYTHEQIYANLANHFGNTITARSNSSNKLSIASFVPGEPEEPEEPKEFVDYTFSDAEIADQKGMMWNSSPDVVAGDLPGETLDGVAFNGKIKFDDYGEPFMHTHIYVRVGTTLPDTFENITGLENVIRHLDAQGAYDWFGGIRITSKDGKLFVRDDIHTDSRDNDFYISAEDLGIDSMLGVYLKLRMTFDVVNNDMIVNMTVSTQDEQHSYTHKQIYADSANKFGNTISARSNSSNKLSIASFLPGDPEEPEDPEDPDKPIIYDTPRKDLSKYKEITFKNALIDDQVVVKDARFGTVPSLDGKVFKGKVTFPSDGGGMLRIGGNTNNSWFGVHIGSVNGGLYLYEASNFDQTWMISKETIGKDIFNQEVELFVTIDCVDEHNIYIGIYVDGKFCGERLYKNMEEAFGNYILVYSPEVGMKIASVATAWQRFLNSGIDLTYFGFSNENWKAELAARSK